MIKLSVDSLTITHNKIRNDIILNKPPIIVWEDGKEVRRVFEYELLSSMRLVYRPESPLPNGTSVYLEVDA